MDGTSLQNAQVNNFSKMTLLLLVALLATYLVESVRGSVSIQVLQARLEQERLPLFEFGRELEELFVEHSDIELFNLFHQYLERISDHYYNDFIVRCGDGNLERTLVLQVLILKECEAAMRAAVPKSRFERWSVKVFSTKLLEFLAKCMGCLQAHLEDLTDDINSFINARREESEVYNAIHSYFQLLLMTLFILFYYCSWDTNTISIRRGLLWFLKKYSERLNGSVHKRCFSSSTLHNTSG